MDTDTFQREMERLRGACIFDIRPACEMYRALMARAEVLEVAFANSHELNETLGNENRTLLARAEAAEAALAGLDKLAADFELPDGRAVAEWIRDGHILTVGRRDSHGKVTSVLDTERQLISRAEAAERERDGLRDELARAEMAALYFEARVAELEAAQLAALQHAACPHCGVELTGQKLAPF